MRKKIERYPDRTVDELGRIVLPIELRNKLKLKEKDKLSLSIEGDNIILIKTLKI